MDVLEAPAITPQTVADHGLSEDPEGVMLNCMLGRIKELEDQLRELQSRIPPPLAPDPARSVPGAR